MGTLLWPGVGGWVGGALRLVLHARGWVVANGVCAAYCLSMWCGALYELLQALTTLAQALPPQGAGAGTCVVIRCHLQQTRRRNLPVHILSCFALRECPCTGKFCIGCTHLSLETQQRQVHVHKRVTKMVICRHHFLLQPTGTFSHRLRGELCP